MLVRYFPSHHKKILIVAGSVIATYTVSSFLLKLYFRYKRNQKRKAYPKNTVILHQFPCKNDSPSMSTPCLKLETWLRIAEIKYENDFSYFDRSSQGQIPFITLNNQDFHDSQFIIEHLTKVYGKDLNDHLSQVEKSIARAFFKLLEESFKWAMYFHRFQRGTAADIGFPSLIFKLMRPRLAKALAVQGYGKHTDEEIYHIGKQDLIALENFLGDKKYLFGDNPSVEDAILFAFISQLVYYDKGPFNAYLKDQCPNLLGHFNSIKNSYWPEWKQIN